ncbi:MAG: pilus assembly FimT family protein [Phycisphaeraceae bacterium]
MRSRRSRSAFTLVEILIVVAILGIVSAIALPTLSGTAESKLRGAARMLVADLSVAQAQSMTDGENLRVVVFDTDDNAYRIAIAGSPETAIQDPIRKQPYLNRFGEGRASHLAGVEIDSVDFDDADGDDLPELAYQLYGNLDRGEPATIVLRHGDRTLTITIDPDTGEATVG